MPEYTDISQWREDDHPAWSAFWERCQQDDSMRLRQRWLDYRNGWEDKPPAFHVDTLKCPDCGELRLCRLADLPIEHQEEGHVGAVFECYNGHRFGALWPDDERVAIHATPLPDQGGDSPCGPCA